MTSFRDRDHTSVLVIAEVGGNHNGDMALARQLIRKAAEAGADCVKFQSYVPELLLTRDAPKPEYQVRETGLGESQFERLQRLSLSRDDHAMLKATCEAENVQFCSSPFDHESLGLLLDMEVPFIKIPSGEITNIPLLEAIGRSGKPIIMSTGMCDMDEVEAALNALQGCEDIALLHCVSNYPARWEDANLRAIASLKKRFGLPVGFSDHTSGTELAMAAVALGAVIVEKHITLDKGMEGNDHKASMDPAEFARMTRLVRNIGPALGNGMKQCTKAEKDVRLKARKSIVATTTIKAGEPFSRENIGCKRPGSGLSPARFTGLLGKRAARDFAKDDFLDEEGIADTAD